MTFLYRTHKKNRKRKTKQIIIIKDKAIIKNNKNNLQAKALIRSLVFVCIPSFDGEPAEKKNVFYGAIFRF